MLGFKLPFIRRRYGLIDPTAPTAAGCRARARTGWPIAAALLILLCTVAALRKLHRPPPPGSALPAHVAMDTLGTGGRERIGKRLIRFDARAEIKAVTRRNRLELEGRRSGDPKVEMEMKLEVEKMEVEVELAVQEDLRAAEQRLGGALSRHVASSSERVALMWLALAALLFVIWRLLSRHEAAARALRPYAVLAESKSFPTDVEGGTLKEQRAGWAKSPRGPPASLHAGTVLTASVLQPSAAVDQEALKLGKLLLLQEKGPGGKATRAAAAAEAADAFKSYRACGAESS